MTVPAALLTATHLVGFAMAMGAATVKLALLIRATRDPRLFEAYLRLARPITQVLIAGVILLVISGVTWLFLGYPFGSRLRVKVALVVASVALGLLIDTRVEPSCFRLAPASADVPSAQFLQARRRLLGVEALATLLFYVITVYWVVE